jgi:subtilisin family serine protease
MSLGLRTNLYKTAIQRLIDAFFDQAGSSGYREPILVAAAGNDANFGPTVPAACEKVYSVAGLSQRHYRWYDSGTKFGTNYGYYAVDFSAYSGGVEPSVVLPGEEWKLPWFRYITTLDTNDEYMLGVDAAHGFSGTSAACPQVAGAFALMRSRSMWGSYPALSLVNLLKARTWDQGELYYQWYEDWSGPHRYRDEFGNPKEEDVPESIQLHRALTGL